MKTLSFQQIMRETHNYKAQQESLQKMAKTPGKHSDNTFRHDLSNIFLHCLSRTTCAQQSCSNVSTTITTVNMPSIIYSSSCHLNFISQHTPAKATSWKDSYKSRNLGKRQIKDDISLDLIQLERQVCQALDKLTQLQATEPTLNNRPAKFIPHSVQIPMEENWVNNKFSNLLSHIASALNQVGEFINFHDPLNARFAEASLLSENKSDSKNNVTQSIIHGIEDKIHEIKSDHNATITKSLKHPFFTAGREALFRYFERYNNRYPGLKVIASHILRERIKQQFHLDIDPDRTYFISFMERFDDGVNMTYFKPLIKKTLTECLFSNFGSDFWKYYVRVDAVSAIYDISYLDAHIDNFAYRDRIKIDPSKFGDLVWKIDFYNYAKQKLTDHYSHKNEHIKNLFISFINHLDSSQIDHDSATDVLNGVGLLKNSNVTAALFDINGYSAANAFIFKNSHSGRVTLYFPKSDFKLFSFRGDFEMRSWVANTCAIEKHRAMIASHFTMANRQNNLFYDGIDAWLNTINNDNDYSDRIAINSAFISSNHFFADLFNSVKNKALSDLKSQIKSDLRVERDIYEEMIEASNIIPNPVSPFLALAFHIEHAIDAVTYDEQMQAWGKIKNDAVSLIIMVVLDKAITLPDTEGYKFIESVKNEVDTSDLSIFNERLKKYGELATSEVRYIYRLAPAARALTTEQIARIKTINAFLPIRTVTYINDDLALNSAIKSYLSRDLLEHEYNFHVGFEADDLVPRYIELARIKYQMAFRSAQENIAMAITKINDISYENKIKEYLSQSLNTRNERILSEAMLRFKVQLWRVRDFLNETERRNYDNIVIVSTERTVSARNPYISRSTILNQDHLRDIPLAFTLLEDPKKRIFIMLDANIEYRPIESSIMGMDVNLLDSTLIHEASHSSCKTLDYCYNEVYEEIYLPGSTQALRRKFNSDIESGEIGKNIFFKKFIIDVYRRFGITHSVNAESGVNLIRTTPMLKSNLIMDNADNFVAHVKHLAYLDQVRRYKRDKENIIDSDKYRYLGLAFIASTKRSAKNASSGVFP
uniref:Dermonecrotic toxin (DNT) (PMT) (Mitogenic toxin) n=1 Tax=Erwinia amylovora ATCC BAA-2158 TaxID=889211 RepID=E5B8D4_ERWAM|nr:Dermonecrotic toxin (DNT) (PMT) (Mitogenic toxin) [Erwinia amylovora ATCC BAA-2158]